jgi:hypothetical protein
MTAIFSNTCPLFCILNLSMFTENESQPLRSLLMHVVHELQQEVFYFHLLTYNTTQAITQK